MKTLENIISLRNKLVYLLSFVLLIMASVSISSYFYNISKIFWIFSIIIFCGLLYFVMRITRKIYDIQHPEAVNEDGNNAE
ncbi:hypothetical protein R4576_18100 [Acinetobacter baumannii]|nr:hypothetical protein [Acinetobacter baumannii]